MEWWVLGMLAGPSLIILVHMVTAPNIQRFEIVMCSVLCVGYTVAAGAAAHMLGLVGAL